MIWQGGRSTLTRRSVATGGPPLLRRAAVSLISFTIATLVLGCTSQDEHGTPISQRQASPTPHLPGAPGTWPPPVQTPGHLPLPLPSLGPTLPPIPTPVIIPPAACVATGTPAPNGAGAEPVVLLTENNYATTISLYQGEWLAVMLRQPVPDSGLVFTDPALVCRAPTSAARPDSQATYRATAAGMTTLRIGGHPIILQIAAHPPSAAAAGPAAPPNVYPPFGHAPDYSWVAGQIIRYSNPNDGGAPGTKNCVILQDLSVTPQVLSGFTGQDVHPQGPAWEAARTAGGVADNAFVVVFGYLAAGYSSCDDPLYTVERIVANVAPAQAGSAGPPPPPGGPRIITAADANHIVEVAIGQQLQLMLVNAYSAAIPWNVQLQHPTLLRREPPSRQAQGSQGLYTAMQAGQSVVSIYYDPCNGFRGCTRNILSISFTVVVR